MQQLTNHSMELVVCIVNPNEADRVIELARKKGIEGGTVFYGEGTSSKGVLAALGLDTVRKEIVLLIAPEKQATEALDYIAFKKKMHVKNKGIGFRLSLSQVLGIYTGSIQEKIQQIEEREYKKMYQGIFAIVNKGEAEDVMDLAQEAGAQGGTIIQARGSGSKEAKKIFNMDIVPEKEMILIISEQSQVEQIVQKISREQDINEPNKGIVFVVDLNETRGIQYIGR